MCGIGGILFSKTYGDSLHKRIKKMEQAQLHRGPDDQQIVIKDNHGFCHQRLALLDKVGGKQPFYDASKRFILIFNGEIYNYEALREQLKSVYPFVSYSDTEVVLASYLVWEESCLEKFIGMFSFLIWDTFKEEAFAARDPLGVKPFVYYTSNGEFVFASEVKAVVNCLDNTLEINEKALAEYVVAPMFSGVSSSLLEGINFLQPGEKLRVCKGRVKKQAYANFKIQSKGFKEVENIASLRSAIEQSVMLSLKADTNVGSFLSGGLDSSILTSLASKYQKSPFHSYTIAFENHPQIEFDKNTIVNSDDFPYARDFACDLKLPFVPVTLDTESILNSLKTISKINDRIPAWEQEISQHFLSAAASLKYKAVLVGDAADETNYGYYFLLNQKVNYGPLGLIHLFGGGRRVSLLSEKIQKSLHPLQLLNEEYSKEVSNNGFDFNGDERERILAMSCLIYKRWLGRLLHNGDVHTMNFGLEARVPFANQNVLEVVSGIGPESGFYEGTEKSILRKAVTGWIPESIRNRKKSSLPRDPRMGHHFQIVLKKLMEQERDFVEVYLNKKELLVLCEQNNLFETDRMILFNMICLLYWNQHYAA